jgi:hypothetical protein
MSGKCSGLHCPGCGDGGGGLALVVLLVVVVAAGSGAATAVASAVVDLLEIAAAVAGGLLVTGCGAAVLVLRARRRRDVRLGASRRTRLTAVPVRPGMPARADMPALPRGNVSAHSREDVEPHVVTSRAPRPRCSRRADRRS